MPGAGILTAGQQRLQTRQALQVGGRLRLTHAVFAAATKSVGFAMQNTARQLAVSCMHVAKCGCVSLFARPFYLNLASDQSAVSPGCCVLPISVPEMQASYPAFDLGNKRANLEVHLRRLDREDRLHRRAVAAVNVNASVEDVWAVLTDYEHLAEFIPNLALCEQLELPHGAPPRFTRLRQVRERVNMHPQNGMHA